MMWEVFGGVFLAQAAWGLLNVLIQVLVGHEGT